MSEMYRVDELQRFKDNAKYYVKLKSKQKKSMGEFCEYLDISRFTLSKYSKRNDEWKMFIDMVRAIIKAHNQLLVIQKMQDKFYEEKEKLINEEKNKTYE